MTTITGTKAPIDRPWAVVHNRTGQTNWFVTEQEALDHYGPEIAVGTHRLAGRFIEVSATPAPAGH